MTRTYDQLVLEAQQAQDDERREIFNELITRFEQAGFNWAYSLFHEREAAEDALQEASLTAFLHLDQLQEPKAFPSWFRQILINICNRMMRHEHINVSALGDEEIASDPFDEIEDNEKRDSVNQAVLQLPEHERVVTELFYYEDYSQNEIAVTLAVPVTTIKKRLQYARERLRGLINLDITCLLSAQMYMLNGGCTAAALELENYVPDLRLKFIENVEYEVLCAY
jgi:RNA polymerase sigma factor (sigma-70 family)